MIKVFAHKKQRKVWMIIVASIKNEKWKKSENITKTMEKSEQIKERALVLTSFGSTFICIVTARTVPANMQPANRTLTSKEN